MSDALLRLPLPLTTDRLLLRGTAPDDVPALHGFVSRPDVCRYLPFDPLDAPRVAERVGGGAWSGTELLAVGDALTLAVERRDDAAVVGLVFLFLRTAPGDGHGGVAELGYVFDPAAGGRGLATEAARAVVDAAFGSWPLHRVFARLDARNDPSARLLERLGLRREALLVEDGWSKGEWSSTLVHAVLAREWGRTG